MMKDDFRILQIQPLHIKRHKIHLMIEYWVMISCTADDEKEDSS